MARRPDRKPFIAGCQVLAVPEKRRRQSRLAAAEADFYTIGYEKLKIDDLFALLREAGVRCLADVRDVPWSRVPAYRKKALGEKLDELGAQNDYTIMYISVTALGNPKEIRKSGCALDEMMVAYRRHISEKARELDELRDLIRDCKTALMCYEADPAECHRSVLAAVMAERYGLSYIDLRI